MYRPSDRQKQEKEMDEELASIKPSEEQIDLSIELTFPASDPVSWATPCKRKEKT